jgi:hypothetical protein
MSLNKYRLKTQFNRTLSLARIVTPDGYVRVNLAGKDVESTVAATKYAPETKVTVKGITDAQVAYLITNKLPYGDRYVAVETPVTTTK